MGTSRRNASDAQQLVLTARDGGCISCRAHAEETHAHHVRFWGFGPELAENQRADYDRRGVKHVDSFFATNVWPNTEGLRSAVDCFYAETPPSGTG